MTVGELMEILEQFNEDTSVRLAQQPAWPFEYGIGQVVEVDVYDEYGVYGAEGPIVYIGEANQLRYLPGIAKEALGW